MLRMIGIGACCGLVALLAVAQNAPTQSTGDRWFSEAANDDHSAALQKVLDAGPGVVRIGPGTFQVHDVTIPANVTLIGSGPATILQASQGRPVLKQQAVSQWRLRDVVLAGEATGKWQERTDQQQHGIVIAGCWGYDISGVTVRDFAGAGVQISSTNLLSSGWADGGRLSHVTAHGNFIGVRFDTRGEYVTATQLNCRHNVTGVVIHAGNTNLATCNIGGNIDGILIDDHENGSHGSITGCLVNHNSRNALWCRNVGSGMVISNCCVFYGTIALEDCRGVTITSSELSCGISVAGKEANRFANNHVIPIGLPFQFATATQVTGNYTKDGDWEHNQ